MTSGAGVGQASFGEGKILLLAGPSSFTASYIKRSLDFVGIQVLSPPGPPSEAFATLTPEDWASVVGCIAADVGPAMFADIVRDARAVPCLFVGSCCGGWFPGPYAWLTPPLAPFQMIDALQKMLRPLP